MNLQEAIKRIAQEILEANKAKAKGDKKAKDFGKGKPVKGKQPFKKGSAKQVKESQIVEQSSDPIVDETAGAICEALVRELADENSVIGNNAFEMMMGSAPDESRLTQVRLEDVEATAELVVQAIFRDPALHGELKKLAMEMIESAADAVQGR